MSVMKHKWDIAKMLFHLLDWGETACHPLLCGDFLIELNINDEIIPLQHQLLDMDRQRPDRQTELHRSGKGAHNSSASPCSNIYVWPSVYFPSVV